MTLSDTEANQKWRVEFLDTIRATSPERLIYLDESGVTTQMTRLYARSRDGAHIHETTPDGRWKILTILGAISTRGMIATMTIEAATDREIFLAYLEEVLCPKLRSGDVVVTRQSQFAQGQRSAPKNRGRRSQVALPATLLARLEPHREGLGQAQTTVARGQGADQRGSRSGHRSVAATAHCRGCQSLVQAPI